MKVTWEGKYQSMANITITIRAAFNIKLFKMSLESHVLNFVLCMQNHNLYVSCFREVRCKWSF